MGWWEPFLTIRDSEEEGNMADDKAPPSPVWIQAVQALRWPLISLLGFVVFWSPINEIANLLPELVGRSESISVAGVKIEVEARIRAQASDEVAELVGDVNREELAILMSSSDNSYTSNSEASMRRRYSRLIDLGAFEEVPPEEFPDDREHTYGVRRTPLGTDAREFLTSIVVDIITTAE